MPASLKRLASPLLSLLLSGCLLGIDSPDESTANAEKRNDVMQATVSGFGWEAKREATTFASVDVNSYAVGGTSGSSSLVVRLVGIGKLGTYSIGGTAAPYATASFTSATGKFGNVTGQPIGTLTITELTPQRIGGTFAFTAPRLDGGSGSVSVTGGSFSIAIIPAYSVPIQR